MVLIVTVPPILLNVKMRYWCWLTRVVFVNIMCIIFCYRKQHSLSNKVTQLSRSQRFGTFINRYLHFLQVAMDNDT